MQKREQYLYPEVSSSNHGNYEYNGDLHNGPVQESSAYATTAYPQQKDVVYDYDPHTSRAEFNQEPNANVDSRRRERRICCCFKTRSGCCLTIFPLVLVLLAVVAFFLWPRYPSFYHSDPFIRDGNSAQIATSAGIVSTSNVNAVIPAVVSSLHSASESNPFFISFPMAIGFFVYSPNYIPLVTDSIAYKAVYLLNGVQNNGLTSNGTADHVTFYGRSNTSFMMPFDVVYQTSASVLGDPVLSALITSCTGSNRQMKFRYYVTITIPVISALGYKPTFEDNFYISCPSQLVDIFNKLSGGLLGSTLTTGVE